MKKSILSAAFYAAICLVCSLTLLTACDKEEEDYVFWDFPPVNVFVFVEDADGNDLLNVENEGHLLGQEIKATFRGEEYKLNATVAETRYYMPFHYGLRLLYDEYGRYYLYFGELAGEDLCDNEELTVYWGDGSSDVVTVYNRLEWKSKNDPEITRRFYLNGEEQAENGAMTVVRTHGDSPTAFRVPWDIVNTQLNIEADNADDIRADLEALPMLSGTGLRFDFATSSPAEGDRGTLTWTDTEGNPLAEAELTVKERRTYADFAYYQNASDKQIAIYDENDIPHFYYYMLWRARYGEGTDQETRMYHAFVAPTADQNFELWLYEDMTDAYQDQYPDKTVEKVSRMVVGKMTQE